MTSMSGEGQSTCSHCGASMQEAQDWCLQCGLGARQGAPSGPGWRSAALAIGATGALALGASAAAYAALQQQRSPAKRVTTVAQKPPLTTTPAPGAPGSETATPNGQNGSPQASTTTPSLKTSTTPPQIPSSTPTPTSNGVGSAQPPTSDGTNASKTNGKGKNAKDQQGNGSGSSGNSPSNTEGGEGEGEPGTQSSQPVAILLDTDAARLYNPGNLAAPRFGDPSLAIDGDATTAWTVQLEQTEAPAVGAGLTLDLNAPLSVAQLTLITETVGITVQIYGTKRANPPESLSSKGWVPLSKRHLVKKRKATIALGESKHRFRQLLVWIWKAPTSSAGQFTGSPIAIDEVQLYEPKPGGN